MAVVSDVAKEMNCMVPREKFKLRITTGCAKGSSVYEFGMPDEKGFRDIQRNDDEPYRGIIVGPVLDADDVKVKGKTLVITQLDDKRVLVHGRMLTVGTPMGIWTEPDSKTTRVSRPITMIEIV